MKLEAHGQIEWHDDHQNEYVKIRVIIPSE